MTSSSPFIYDASQRFVEPPDLWSSRLSAKHKDAAPVVVAFPEGGEAWSFEGGALMRPLGLEVSAGSSPLELKEFGYTYDSIRKGAYDAKERVRDLDIDEVDVANILPTYALTLRSLSDGELQKACVRAYNEAVWDWCQEGDPARLVPQALIPYVGIDAAMDELNFAIKKGFKGIVFNGWPCGDEEPQESDDRFWAQAEEAGLVIDLVQGGPNITASLTGEPIRAATEPVPIESLWSGRASAKGTNVAWMVYTAIFQRFPTLKAALLETGAGWLPFYLETVNDIFRRSRFWAHPFLKYTPSEYIQRNVSVTVEGDRFAIEARADIGVNALLWATGYPGAASNSVWPSSKVTIEAQFLGVPDGERRRILGKNCADLYGVTPKVAVA